MSYDPFFYTQAVLVTREAIRDAIEKHGLSMETVPDGDRLAILTEEVGEVANAINEIRHAEEARVIASKWCGTETLEAHRERVRRERDGLRDELAQVAACALRWLAALGPRETE
jgi:hypothetical protein